ncbi:MAG: NADH-quinone oxidoreductase subunit J family protein [Egibacteraceae bacterium]
MSGLTGADVFMLGLIVLGGAAALSVVVARNVVHAALYLVVTLLSVAGTFLLLGAEFLAWTQVLVYVGAVVVLILFGLMLTRAPIGPMAQHNEDGMLAAGVSGGLFVFLCVVTYQAFGDARLDMTPTPTGGQGGLGEVLYVQWALPFMALGFLLTVALIGAIVMARREEGEGPAPEADSELAELERGHVHPREGVTASPGSAPREEEGVR